MSIRYLLDTNTVSFHIRESSRILQSRLKRTRADSVGISVVTEMELRYGLARNPKLRIAPLVEAFLAGVTVAPMTSDAAGHYATIRSVLESKGKPIGPLDLMIAAHALALGATLITNLDEFRRVPGLRSVDWTR